MYMNSTYKIILAIGICILAAAIGIGLYLWVGPYFKAAPIANNNPSSTSADNITTTTSEATTSKNNNTAPVKTAKPAPKALTYSEAVNLYVNKRLQFDANCAMTPNFVVFKKGAQIMLDNRFNQARPIYLDGVQYNIGAFGFKIVTLTTASPLPHTVGVDCGTGKNNGQIILE